MNSKTDSAKAHGCCSGGDKTSTANEAVDTKTQTRQVSSEAGEIQLNIQGASCASCVTKIETALKQVAGVTSAEMNFAQRMAMMEDMMGQMMGHTAEKAKPIHKHKKN